MAATSSTMLPLGTEAPYFRLPDTRGKEISLDYFKEAPALLVIFMCNHCPFVKHIRSGLLDLTKTLHAQGVGIVGINSNDITSYPEDNPIEMAKEVEQVGYTFPYCFDETQQVAKDYRAACTPDFFLFDRERKLVYRGQMDDSRPGNGLPVTGSDLREAVLAVLEGRPVSDQQTPSIGCNIKWKPGNEPEYF